MQPKGRYLSGPVMDIIGGDHSISKSNRSQVGIFRYIFMEFEVYFIDTSKTIGNYLEILNFNRLFPKLNRFM
jgi:hypothetical protein